jgi:cyclohexyl-isocyanide hydratase
MTDPVSVGLLLFPRLTQLDLTGPFEVFSRTPGVTVHLIWKSLDPVTSDSGMSITPTATFADAPPLDIICVPGGPGVAELMEDDETLAFLRQCAENADYVTSVCTGSLVLGAAGLLTGKRATCHWMSRDLLPHFGAEAIDARIVRDGNTITGGGVTAGIDFAFCRSSSHCAAAPWPRKRNWPSSMTRSRRSNRDHRAAPTRLWSKTCGNAARRDSKSG